MVHRPSNESLHERLFNAGLHGFHKLQFCCAICGFEVRDIWNRQVRDISEWPLCRYCELTWGMKPSHGAFRDRRLAAQIRALAVALDAEAHCMMNGAYRDKA